MARNLPQALVAWWAEVVKISGANAIKDKASKLTRGGEDVLTLDITNMTRANLGE